MKMPTELVAQNGATPISVSTPVTVAGCAKSNPASATKKKKKKKKKNKRKNGARCGRGTERRRPDQLPTAVISEPTVKKVRPAPTHKREQRLIGPPRISP